MVLGLRPEHLTQLKDPGKPGVASLHARLEVTEPMGMEIVVHFRVNGTALCGRVDPAITAIAGNTLPMSVDLNHMHLIEPESGRVV
jgi:multiple sugar transport system ATP-binding protein